MYVYGEKLRILCVWKIFYQVNVQNNHNVNVAVIIAARLAQWDKGRSAEREAVGSNPERTNTQDL